jgi:prolyl-tRNA synthetase
MDIKLNKITTQEESFEKWYTDIIREAELVSYGRTKGTMIIEPNGWSIWTKITNELNRRFEKLNVRNLSMPTLIPVSDIEKEKNHLEGFSPECFMVTRKGNEELTEKLILRPTSEVVFADYFSKKIKSEKNLPMILNQWCNVFRAEKTTRPFLRTSEFHWQEGHTCHSNKQEAKKLSMKMIRIYEKFCKEFLSIAVIVGEKTVGERFAGAENTYTIESVMKDGQALQSATSHYLGSNFAIPYEIKYQNSSNNFEYVHQTSWGISTRIIGSIIMNHGDNKGLVLPSTIAIYDVAIITIGYCKNEKVKFIADRLYKELSRKYNVKIYTGSEGVGYQSAEQEILGTPVRIEVGPRDLELNNVTIVTRDNSTKKQISLESVMENCKTSLKESKERLYQNSLSNLKSRIVNVRTLAEFESAIEQGKMAYAPWSGTSEDEKAVKERYKVTPRCAPFNIEYPRDSKNDKCFFTGKKSKSYVIFSRAY